MSAPVFSGLAVVQRGDVLPVEPTVWSALRTPSVLAIPYALDQLLAPLTAAVGT